MNSAQHELRLSLIAGERCYVQEHTVVVQTTVDVEGKEPLTQIAAQPTVMPQGPVLTMCSLKSDGGGSNVAWSGSCNPLVDVKPPKELSRKNNHIEVESLFPHKSLQIAQVYATL